MSAWPAGQTMLEAGARGFTSEGTQEPAERIRIECGDVPATLRRVFKAPITSALAGRLGCYEVVFGPGREPSEVLVVIRVTGRRLPLSLFFPEAASLRAEEVERIVRNVLEGMGPSFP